MDRRNSNTEVDNESLGEYLNQIGRVRLLTPQEVIEHAHRRDAGLAATQQLAEYSNIGEEQRTKLEYAITDGLEACTNLAAANLRLVVSVAKRYQHQGLPLNDLIQEGNLGLLRAVDKFDQYRNIKFSTYAIYWIKQAIRRGLSYKRANIRLPLDIDERVGQLKRYEGSFDLWGDLYTPERQAWAMGVSAEQLRKLKVAQSISRTISGDELLRADEGDATLFDMLADPKATEELMNSEDKESAGTAAKFEKLAADIGLDEREIAIILARFYYPEGTRRPSLDALEQDWQTSRAALSYLERKALRKVRDYLESNPLQKEDFFVS